MGRTRENGNAKATPRGVTIRKHSSGTETVQIAFSYRGVECRESTGLPVNRQNITYAERLLAEINNAISRNTFNYLEYFPGSKRAKRFGHAISTKTISDLLDLHVKVYENMVENGQLSPSTLEGYRKIINGHLRPAFGIDRVRDLGPVKIRQWIAGLGTTAKTARNIVSVFRSVLDDAVNDGLIESSPLDKVALKRLIQRTTKKSAYEVDPFDDEEKKAIIAAAFGHARNFIQFAFWTGLRTSELIGLEWGDIDWVHGCVRVQRAVVVKTKKDTKTEAGTRDVVLLPLARAALESQKELTLQGCGRVFYNPQTGRPWETDAQIRKTMWIPTLKKARVRYRNPYQTRHTYASTLLSGGENPWWVATQMGHVDVEMIFRNYGKWIPDKSKKLGYQTINNWESGSVPNLRTE